MPNINKVVFGTRTLLDVSGVTVAPEVLMSGYTAVDNTGTLITGTAVAGSGSAVVVTDTTDSHGGTIREITAVSLAGDTVRPDVLLSGYTAHNSLGEAIVGTASGGGGGTYQSKSVNPSTSQQVITADAGYDALSSVTVNAMTLGSAATPATSITANPSISVSNSGLITASVSASKSVTPTVSAGYVSSGTAGTVSVSGSNTQQLTTKAAATYNTSSSDQTIASGQYLTGTQTIKAVTYSGLSAGNIAAGVTVKIGDANDDDRIVSVTGTLAFQTIYSGTGAPSSSLGVNGDVYIRTA